ncbi:exosortase B [Nitrosomonas ureae]|uniref:Exosortase B n=1 Tax=Nitrosomonas ureae TaxID=44577 RepID=A0A0S3AM70_9PROT|nr:exosortase B [Nitrosomonas ureae]ALQ52258.1 exosortase B [Nitrosomonas ureae]PTQ80225.1 exosortase B [Nitrosomonas ureae]PXX10169.1 exosortase B [Nitrosomonas ureae]SDU24038.1 exosortase B [Nitrosomonas ureae]SEQ35166.1 exosortase B [Nitrosomonas ureae]
MPLYQLNSPKSEILDWWPIILGVLALYIPTFYSLANGIWTNEEHAHGPIILILSLWLIFRKWKIMIKKSDGQSASAFGWVILLVALIFYIVGGSQQVLILEIGSFILVLAAILLIKLGYVALKIMWFPLFFLLFMIPLPGVIVSFFTMPMKMAVSYVAENILFWANYPIARNGVVLQIGQYQLLVADACAGLQTLLTLEALGLFYLNLVHHTSIFRNVALAILIIPISFTANVIRVIVLTLITYHYGDAAGQGFLHGFAGMVLFISALILILGVDGLLQYFARTQHVNVILPVRNI